MSKEKMELPVELLEMVSGGSLADGWEGILDSQMARFTKSPPLKVLPGADEGSENKGKPYILPLVDFIGDNCSEEETLMVKKRLKDKYGIVVL